MRITKLGHSCVRISVDGHEIVLDPGGFTEPGAVDGATAVLLTHEHPDHWTAAHLRSTDAPIWTTAAVRAAIADEDAALAERVTVVAPGDRIDVGVPVTVVGERHAVIHPEIPRIDNSGYLLEVEGTRIFHPGDALTVPDEAVDLLLLPATAPWLKIGECIDYARDVGAGRNLAIHDAIYSAAGFGIVDGLLSRFLAPHDQSYVRLSAGADL